MTHNANQTIHTFYVCKKEPLQVLNLIVTLTHFKDTFLFTIESKKETILYLKQLSLKNK